MCFVINYNNVFKICYKITSLMVLCFAEHASCPRCALLQVVENASQILLIIVVVSDLFLI